MCSKRFLGVILLITILTGCSIAAKDGAELPAANFDTSGGCMSNLGDVVKSFGDGTLGEADHGRLFDCVDKAVVTFGEYTAGRNTDYFDADEIGGFLSKYFLNGQRLQPNLLQQGMLLKAALIGGDPNRISRDDLQNLRRVFALLRELTGKIRPLMPMTAESYIARGTGPDEFAANMQTFINAAADFGDKSKGLQGDYKFENLASLMRELQLFLFNGHEAPADHWTNTMITVAKSVPNAKAILFSPPAGMIRSNDWYSVYRQGARYLVAVIRTKYYFHNPWVLAYGSGLRTLEGLLDEFVDTFQFALDQHAGGAIPSAEIDGLIADLDANKLLPCTPATARNAIRMLFGKLLGTSPIPENFTITKDSVNFLKENLTFLFEGERATEALYRKKYGDSFLSGTLTRAEIEAVSADELLKSTRFGNALSREAVENVRHTPADIRTVVSSGDFSVTVPVDGVTRDQPYVHVMKMHLLRAGARLLIHSYGTAATNRLSAAQVQQLLADAFPILVETGLVKEAMRGKIAKRVTEASLFLPSSDGQDGLSMNETVELVTLLLSTVENAKRIHALLAEACHADHLSTPEGTPIPGRCYREQYMALYGQVLGFVPGTAAYLGKMNMNGRVAVFDKMQAFLFPDHTADDYYMDEDTQSYVLIPYYLEMIFSRFDANRDGFLVNAEGDHAFPIFSPFIAKKANAQGQHNPKDYAAIFNFILGFRKLPTDDVWDYIVHRYLLGPEKYKVDRSLVVDIFALLMKM